MAILKDSDVFIKNSIDELGIRKFTEICLKHNKKLTITNIILRELSPGPGVADKGHDVYLQAIERHKVVQKMIQSDEIDCIDINKNDQILDNYNNIRRRYYSWTTSSRMLNRLVEQGAIDKRRVDSGAIMYDGVGECSLVAVAMTDKPKYMIVSNYIN